MNLFDDLSQRIMLLAQGTRHLGRVEAKTRKEDLDELLEELKSHLETYDHLSNLVADYRALTQTLIDKRDPSISIWIDEVNTLVKLMK